MTTPPPYSITHESISVVWDGKTHTVPRGAPNFKQLRDALLEGEWDAVPGNLTALKSISEWAKGKFTVTGEFVFYDGVQLPGELNSRILALVGEGKDPSAFFSFWERLQQNPSYRSVHQLWPFLQHQGIPLTPDGCFLAYKSVKDDYMDVHSGKFENKPGAVHEMPRNKISDDPNTACHEGFHVGALTYARSFHAGGRIVVCKVDPVDVICVPYDESAMKMRVCKYEVIGNHNGEYLPSTVSDDPLAVSASANEDTDDGEDEDYEDYDEENDPLLEHDSEPAEPEEVESHDSHKKPVTVKKAAKKTKRSKGVSYAAMDKMEMGELLELSMGQLRKYAIKKVKIVGASHIPGGKVALVDRIMTTR